MPTFEMHIKPLKQYRAEKELSYIRCILAYYKGSIARTATALGVDRKTIYNKLSAQHEIQAKNPPICDKAAEV